MKKISICIPCYNEVENIENICHSIQEVMLGLENRYKYEIIMIDNASTDGTREKIRKICQENSAYKAIFNTRNFGPICSPVYGMLACSGDCVIQMAADFQDPPELIPEFIEKWERGDKIVIGKKSESDENRVKFFVRSLYYKAMKKIANIEHIEHFTGFGLYDRQFVEIVRLYDDPTPYLRGIVCESGMRRGQIVFRQPIRKRGKTKTNFFSLYDFAMLGITSYSKVLLRMATICGFVLGVLSIIIALIYLIMKLLYWNSFPMGTAPILIGVFFFGAIQLFFIGLMGEYVLSINLRSMKRPLVIEECRINFDEK